jgi:hypothetical protein
MLTSMRSGRIAVFVGDLPARRTALEHPDGGDSIISFRYVRTG